MVSSWPLPYFIFENQRICFEEGGQLPPTLNNHTFNPISHLSIYYNPTLFSLTPLHQSPKHPCDITHSLVPYHLLLSIMIFFDIPIIQYRMSLLETEIESQGVINLRQKGTMHRGKIYKGSIQDAGSKCSIGSIPSTFEGIIYRANSVQAFGSSCQRFQSSLKSNISPGMYSANPNLPKTSFNKKGGGTLLSKVERKIHQVKEIPGPGKYTNLDSTAGSFGCLNDVNLRKSSSTRKQNLKQKSFVPRFSNDQNQVPGPGSYKTDIKKPVSGCQSSFKSEFDRNNYGINDTPGPGFYQYQSSPKAQTKKVKISEPQVNYDTLLHKYMGEEIRSPDIDYTIPDFQPKYFKIKNSSGFAHNGRDRFGYFQNQYRQQNRMGDDKPGPGAYDSKSVFNVDKQYVSSSAFLNSTVRQAFKDAGWKYGPNQKEVKLLGKKEFNINMQGKWI